METIKNWFQDWSDACEYANECAPDLSFLTLAEPYAGLLWIAAGCFFIWAINEMRIQASHQARHFKQQPQAPKHRLKRVLAGMRGAHWREKKLIA